MKKILFFIIIICICFFGYYYYKNIYDKGIPVLDVESEKVIISEYYIYGTSLNMVGKVNNIDTKYTNVDLVLYNGKFKKIKINAKKDINNLSFYITDEINNGYDIDNISLGKYYMFLRFTYKNNKEGITCKYYALNNKTDYKKSSFYTTSNRANKININSNNDYNTMMLDVSKNNDKEIYDIVIDPGHGGEDGGATLGKNYEKDLVMSIADKVKERITDAGYKVKLTREANQFKESEYFEEYNVSGVNYTGRAVIPQEVHAKYLISIHVNSSSGNYVNGLELYAPDNINYDFAQLLIDNVVKETGIGISNNSTFRISPGIYVHNYTENEIALAKERYDRLKHKHYDLSTKSNYLYMIREPGGYLTGAYVDERNPDTVGVNPYYNSNIGVESYLIELGYLTNSGDLEIIKNKQNEYAKALADSFITKLKK